jgi:hypothetical protein
MGNQVPFPANVTMQDLDGERHDALDDNIVIAWAAPGYELLIDGEVCLSLELERKLSVKATTHLQIGVLET